MIPPQFPDSFIFKTKPRGKQGEVIARGWWEPIRAFLCRPGTGKSKLNIDTAALQYLSGFIEAWIIVSPDGVHTQWTAEQLPKHMSDAVSWVGGAYSSKDGVRAHKALDDKLTCRGDSLKVLSLSFDGLQTPRGLKMAMRLATQYKCMVTIDESHRVANSKNAGYKAVSRLMLLAKTRRIATGTLLRQNPFSAYGQYELLKQACLGFGSLSAFKAMYAKLLDKDNGLYQAIQKSLKAKTGKTFAPQVQAKDSDGKPIYKNLDDLRRRLENYSDFLTLADVSGTEPIVNISTRYVEMSPRQARIYGELTKIGIAFLDEHSNDRVLIADSALALATRQAQVVGGFAPNEDNPLAEPIDDTNERIAALLDQLDDWEGEKVVIWARFKPELLAIAAALRAVHGQSSTVEYHGDVSPKDRAANKLAFTSYDGCRYFVGQQQAGGTGLDGLQGVAHQMIFYSNGYAYLDREQCIARLARTDGADVVNVVDLMCAGTVDEDVVKCMQSAQDVTERVLLKRYRET